MSLSLCSNENSRTLFCSVAFFLCNPARQTQRTTHAQNEVPRIIEGKCNPHFGLSGRRQRPRVHKYHVVSSLGNMIFVIGVNHTINF